MVWCQEEPKNQGAWSFIEPNIEWVLTRIGAKTHPPRVYAGRANIGLARDGSGQPTQSPTTSAG